MQNVSPAFLSAVQQPGGREFRSKVVVQRTGYSDITYDDTRIVSIKRTGASVGSQAFSIGDTVSSTFTVTLKNIDGELDGVEYRDAVLIPSIGVVLPGGSVEYCPLGKYYIDNDNIERGDGSVILPAYDGMIKLTALYISNLMYPATLLQIAQEIASKSGLTLATTDFPNASLSITDKPDLGGTTLRQALGWVAEAACSFAQIDRTGDIALVWYSGAGISIDTHGYFTLSHADTTIPAYDGVKLMAADTDLSGPTQGTSSNPLKIVANPLLTWYDSSNTAHYNTDAMAAICGRINGFTFMPFDCKWQGNPALDAGDAISLTDTKGANYSSYVMDDDMEYAGGLYAATQAYGLDVSQSSAAGGLTAKVNKVTTEQQQFENLTATNFSAVNSDIANLSVEKLNVTDAAIQYATVQQLNVTNENVNTIKGQSATFLDVLSDNGTFDDLTTSTATANYAALLHGTLGDAQIGSLSVAKLLAGVISTTKFTLQSDSGRLSLADNTMQVSDANRVRVQLGKDGNGDYNIYVWDASGNLMFDAAGLHSSGIKSGIIRDSMVASDAAINATKIDKESMVSQINGATTLLNSSRVKYDSTGQTLTVAFDALKTTVTSQGSTLSTQGTAISTVQGQITSKIWTTDIASAMSGLTGSGRNVFYNTAFKTLDTANWYSRDTSVNTISVDSSNQYNGYNSIKIVANEAGSAGHDVAAMLTVTINKNDVYSISFWAKASNSLTLTARVGMATLNTAFNLTTTWQKFSAIIPTSDMSSSYNGILWILSMAGTAWIALPKLEQGTVATGWSPAPEDTATAISTNSSAITQLNNQIALKVDTSTYNSDIGSLQSRMSSAEQKITSSAIVSTVTASSQWSSLSSTANTASTTASSAASAASAAQTTANSKNKTFTSQPTPPYSLGDLWTSTTQETRVCTTARSSGSYTASDWTTASSLTESRMQTAESKITPSAITLTVKQNLGGADIASIINATATDVTINTSHFKVEATSIDLDGLINSLNVTDLRAQRIHNSSDDSCYGTIGAISYFTWDSFINGSGGTVSKQGFQLNAKPAGYSLYDSFLNIVYADGTHSNIAETYINNGDAQALNIIALGGALTTGCGIRLDSVTGNIDINTSGDDYLGYGRIKLNGPVYTGAITSSGDVTWGANQYFKLIDGGNNLLVRNKYTGSGIIYLMSNGGVNVVNESNSAFVSVTAAGFTNASLTDYKQGISKVTTDMRDVVRAADIVQYWYNGDNMATDKPLYGCAIGGGYNVPDQIISRDGKGINQYSMTAVLYKAVQEDMDITDQHTNEIALLNAQIAALQSQIEALKSAT